MKDREGQSCRGVLVQVQEYKCGSQTFGWVLVKAKFPFTLSAGRGLVGSVTITQLGFVLGSNMAVGDFSYLMEENLLKDFTLHPFSFLDVGN